MEEHCHLSNCVKIAKGNIFQLFSFLSVFENRRKQNERIKRHGKKPKCLGDMQKVLWSVTQIHAWCSAALGWLFTTSEKNPSNCCHMQDHNQCWFRWTWGIQLMQNFLTENFTDRQCKLQTGTRRSSRSVLQVEGFVMVG